MSREATRRVGGCPLTLLLTLLPFASSAGDLPKSAEGYSLSNVTVATGRALAIARSIEASRELERRVYRSVWPDPALIRHGAARLLERTIRLYDVLDMPGHRAWVTSYLAVVLGEALDSDDQWLPQARHLLTAPLEVIGADRLKSTYPSLHLIEAQHRTIPMVPDTWLSSMLGWHLGESVGPELSDEHANSARRTVRFVTVLRVFQYLLAGFGVALVVATVVTGTLRLHARVRWSAKRGFVVFGLSISALVFGDIALGLLLQRFAPELRAEAVMLGEGLVGCAVLALALVLTRRSLKVDWRSGLADWLVGRASRQITKVALWSIGGIGLVWLADLTGSIALPPEERVLRDPLLFTSGNPIVHWPELALTSFTVVVIRPALEEVLFRGALFGSLRAVGGPVLAVLGSAMVFSLFHLTGGQDLLPLFLFGVVLALIHQVSGSLAPCFLVHAANNAWGRYGGVLIAQNLSI